MLTWNRFFDDPGRLSSLFSPTLRDPSLILEELAVNGSGAATFDSFYRKGDGNVDMSNLKTIRIAQGLYLLTLLAYHLGAKVSVVRVRSKSSMTALLAER